MRVTHLLCAISLAIPLVAQSGTFIRSGTGCPSATPPVLELRTVPRIGATHVVRVDRLPGDTAATAALLGLAPTSLLLDIFGAPGCTLLVDQVFASDPMVMHLPMADWQLSLPNQTAIIGAAIEIQAVVLSASSNALGLALSDRGRLTVGWAKTLPAISGLVLHLDASNVLGDGRLLEEGDFVSRWNDLSTGGHHAVAGASQPIYRANVIHGRPAIDFGKSRTDVLATPGSSAFAGPTATMFVVAVNSQQTVVSVTVPGSINDAMLLLNGNTYHHTSHGQFSSLAHPTPVTGPCIHEAQWEQPVAAISNVVDGVNSTVGLGIAGSPKPYPLIVQRAVYVGERGDPSYENGSNEIAEVIVYDRLLSAAERDRVGSYLAVKYGLATAYSGNVR